MRGAQRTGWTLPINSRDKGQRAEREVAGLLADLLGRVVSRRIQNFKNDYDLIGLEQFGFAAEVKHYASVTDSLKAGWWAQAEEQARIHKLKPVLFYRGNRMKWRAVVPASLFLGGEGWEGLEWTMEMSLEAFAAVARAGAATRPSGLASTSASTNETSSFAGGTACAGSAAIGLPPPP